MTDLDLPNLELGRYVDLVKRRRWQLVPIGLLGLLIGFIVAWSIPRYYEANTKVQLRPRLIGGQVSGSDREDPFLREVNKARITIQNYQLVQHAIEELGWEDYFAVKGDPEKEPAYIWDVVSRVSVLDLDPSTNRSSATLEISFRDQDPLAGGGLHERPARGLLRERAPGPRAERAGPAQRSCRPRRSVPGRSSTGRARRCSSSRRRPATSRANTDDTGGRRELRSRQQELRELERGEQELASADRRPRDDAGPQAASASATSIKRRPDPAGGHRCARDPAGPARQAYRRQQADDRQLGARPSPATRPSSRRSRPTRICSRSSRRRSRRRASTPSPTRTYLALQKEIAEDGERLAGLKRRLEVQQDVPREGEGGQRRAARDPQRPIATLEREVRGASEALDDAEDAVNAQRKEVALLQSGDDVIIQTLAPATPPLAPSYPNRLLLTLIGLGIGLAFAIVSILVLDFLQPTWKSLDEVARGLGGLPALGGVAHLDLPEELEAAGQKRARIALTSSVVVLLLAAILTVYFLEPLRLPEPVRVVLDSVPRRQGLISGSLQPMSLRDLFVTGVVLVERRARLPRAVHRAPVLHVARLHAAAGPVLGLRARMRATAC